MASPVAPILGLRSPREIRWFAVTGVPIKVTNLCSIERRWPIERLANKRMDGSRRFTRAIHHRGTRIPVAVAIGFQRAPFTASARVNDAITTCAIVAPDAWNFHCDYKPAAWLSVWATHGQPAHCQRLVVGQAIARRLRIGSDKNGSDRLRLHDPPCLRLSAIKDRSDHRRGK